MTPRTESLRRWAVAVCLVAAPLLEVIESAISPLAATNTRSDLAAIASHRSAFVVSLAFGIPSTLLMVVALLGLARLAWLRHERLGLLTAVLLVASMGGFLSIRLAQVFELQLSDSRLPLEQAAALFDSATAQPLAMIMIVLFLGGSMVGLPLLAVLLWRSSRVPRLAAVLVGAFPILDWGLQGHWGTLAAHALLLLGLSSIAATLLMHPERWSGATAEKRRAAAPAAAIARSFGQQ